MQMKRLGHFNQFFLGGRVGSYMVMKALKPQSFPVCVFVCVFFFSPSLSITLLNIIHDSSFG